MEELKIDLSDNFQVDNYYDGIIEGHNDRYFVTCEDMASDERRYLLYPMDHIFRYLLECPLEYSGRPQENFLPRSDGYDKADLSGSDWCSFHLDLLLAARAHAGRLKPLGYIMERYLPLKGP